MNSTTDNTAVPPPTRPELGLSMTKILRNPLLALRASMESLATELGASDPRAVAVKHALEQVLEMSRGVETLVTYASPRTVRPQRCSIAEIVQSARRGLRFDQAARVEVVDQTQQGFVTVDPGLLAGSLHCLLAHALATSGDSVLLSARRDEGRVTFAIVEQAPCDSFDALSRSDLPPGEVAAAKLGFEIAFRDIARIGGRLTAERTPHGNRCVSIELPEEAS